MLPAVCGRKKDASWFIQQLEVPMEVPIRRAPRQLSAAGCDWEWAADGVAVRSLRLKHQRGIFLLPDVYCYSLLIVGHFRGMCVRHQLVPVVSRSSCLL